MHSLRRYYNNFGDMRLNGVMKAFRIRQELSCTRRFGYTQVCANTHKPQSFLIPPVIQISARSSQFVHLRLFAWRNV